MIWLVLINLIVLLIIERSNWAMDSYKFHPLQIEGTWLERLDNFLHRLKWPQFKLWILRFPPKAFCDGWHFMKMIMVGGIIYLVTWNISMILFIGITYYSILIFTILSIAWNLYWFVIYDVKYHNYPWRK